MNEPQLPQISFRKWYETKAKGPDNKICPMRCLFHHEQFNLTAGHLLDVKTDLDNKVEKKISDKNNKNFYKHQIAIQVMHAILKHEIPPFPFGFLERIPVWQQNIQQQLEPLLLELRTVNDTTKQDTPISPTMNQLNKWLGKFTLVTESVSQAVETNINC